MLSRGSRVVVAVLLSSASAAADVIILRDGQRIEGLVVAADSESLVVRSGAGAVSASRRIRRTDIALLRLAPPEVGAIRDQARRADVRGDVREAAENWQVVGALHPETLDDQLARARSLRLAGRPQEAAAAADAAEKLSPLDPRVPLEQGEARLLAGDFRRAARHALDHLKRTDSGSVAGHWLLGRSFEGSNMPEDAIESYSKVLAAEPSHLEAMERLVALQTARQAVLEAERAVRAFVRAAPAVRAGPIALGKVLYRQARYEEAMKAFLTATSLGGPGYDRARIFLNVARARAIGGDPVLGSAERETAAELDPALGKEKRQ